VKDGVHKTAQLELNSPADRKPVQLKKADSDMQLKVACSCTKSFTDLRRDTCVNYSS